MSLFSRCLISVKLIVLIISLPISLFAKGIKGTITDDLGNSLPGASIFIKEIQTGATTNSEGFYEIGLKNGTYTVAFQTLGFLSQEHEIKISDNWLNLDIKMKPIEFQLKEVRIYSDRKSVV